MVDEGLLLYLEQGVKSTTKLIDTIIARIDKGDLDTIIVASTKGNTAVKIAEATQDAVTVVSVTEFTYDDEVKKTMKKLKIVPVERVALPIQDRPGMGAALNLFGAGMKAALEVAAIAAERKLTSGKIIAVGGGGRGLDTALVVSPAEPADFMNPDPKRQMAVLEILAMRKRE